MKLKKIASLALAGVMAVSMLAGCATKGEENTQKEENQVVAATVADYANSLLSAAQKNVFEFKNSTELTAALQKVASDSEKFDSDDIIALKNVYAYDNNAYGTIAQALGAELKDEMKADFDNKTGTGLKSITEKGTKTAVYAYVVSGNLEQDTAVQLVVNGWKNATMNGTDYFPTTIAANANTSNPAMDCDYTAEISAVKVTAPDDKTASVWVIAMAVTQTATEVPNV